ncbi:MAG: hypothetical protein U9N78_06010 [Actinomycetota bacterium]|nr:hypothetical protein [Actinomycetota bacterium]
MNWTHDDSDDFLAEFADLWSAETADDLHRVLALQQPFRSSADWFEPYSLLARHHKSEPHTSTVTATLLLTDMRWRKGVSRLVRGIAESGIIDAADLDILARTFVGAGDHIYWEVPESWFGNEWIEIYLDGGTATANDTDDGDDEVLDNQRMVVARRVHPPLRRWAVAHLVTRDPSEWGPLLVNARDRSSRDGAAMVRGLLDGLDFLPDATRRAIVDVGVDWPQVGVRKHALEWLADLGDRQLAHDRALEDTSERIREWAPALLETEPTVPDETVDPGVGTATDSAQESLF